MDLPYDVNLSILFTELPLLERPQAAKEAGFAAVEFWWPWPDQPVPADTDVDAFVGAVRDAGVQLIGLNFAAGDLAGPDLGLVSVPDRSAELRDNVDVTVGIGERLGCRAFNALYGVRVDSVRRTSRWPPGPRRGSVAPYWSSRSAGRSRTRCAQRRTRSR